MNVLDAQKRENREDCIVVWGLRFPMTRFGTQKAVGAVVIDLSLSERMAAAKKAFPGATEAALFYAALSDPKILGRVSSTLAVRAVEIAWGAKKEDMEREPNQGEGSAARNFRQRVDSLEKRFEMVFYARKPPIDSEWGCPAPCLVAIEAEPVNLLMALQKEFLAPEELGELARALLVEAASEALGAHCVVASAVKAPKTEQTVQDASDFAHLARAAWDRRALLDAASSSAAAPTARRKPASL